MEKTKADLILEVKTLRSRLLSLEKKNKKIESANDELKRSGENFKVLADNLSYAVLIMGGDGAFIYANKRASEITGYDIDELLSVNIKALAHPDSLPIITAKLQSIVNGQAPVARDEVILVTKSRALIPIELIPIPIPWQGHGTAIAIFRELYEKKLIEDTLKRNEEHLKRSQSLARIGSWERDLVTNETHWSDELYRIFGMDPDEIKPSYNAFMSSVHPDDREFVDKSVIAAIHENKAYNIEYRLIRADGAEIMVHAEGNVVFDGAGRPIRNAGIIQDITERKETDDLQKRLVAIIEETTDFVGMADKEGRALYLNKAARRILGIREDEDISTIRAQNTHPAWANKIVFEKAIPTAMSEGTWRGETAFLSRDGREIPVLQGIIVHKDKDGAIKFLSTIAHDMTEKRLADEMLRRSKEELQKSEVMYRKLVEYLPPTIWIYIANADNIASTIYVSPQITRTGYSQEEWIKGRDFWSRRLHPDDRSRVLEDFQKGRTLDKPFHSEYRLLTRDGRAIWLRDDCMLIRDENGKPLLFQGVVQDITEQLKAQDDISDKTRELALLNKELRSMAKELTLIEEKERKEFAEMLHENIGQNLVSIRLICETCLACLSGKDRNARGMSHVISILDETIRSTRSMTTELYPVPIDDITIEEAVKRYMESFLSHSGGPKVTIDMSAAQKSLIGKKKKILFRIIRECLQNALKHACASNIKVAYKKSAGRMRLTVSDDGKGFDVSKVKTKTERGFGLILMREWAGSINGDFEIRSSSGKGTEVTVAL